MRYACCTNGLTYGSPVDVIRVRFWSTMYANSSVYIKLQLRKKAKIALFFLYALKVSKPLSSGVTLASSIR